MDKVIMRTISKVKTIKQHLNNNSYLILLLPKPFYWLRRQSHGQNRTLESSML